MRNLSVTTFIHILFSVAILILIATFLLFLSWDKDRHKIEEYKRYQLISITFLSKLQQNQGKEDLDDLYNDLRVKPLSEKKTKEIKQKIETEGETIFTGGSSLGQVRVFKIEDEHFIYVQRMQHNLLLEDDSPENYYFEIAIALGVFLIGVLIVLYLAVLRKLYPLKKLHKQIQRFAQGDMQTRITYLYDDEIGKIAKSFDDAIVHINALSRSKNLFMRNVMHELKTPITKGRIVVEMMEDEASKKILVRAFERMNELISELAEIERVTTQSFEPTFEYVMLDEVIRISQELLMTGKDNVTIDVKNVALATDIKLLALAIKNLLDNGIKYSKDKHVTLKTVGNTLEISSKGEKLQHPLSYYVEPFSQEEKRSSGFGLGLYIVYNILEKLGCGLGYKYVDGYNIFIIKAGDACRFG
jgi:two-component system OmpR family sensor kinase